LQQEFFSYYKKKGLVQKTKNLAARKKLFCHYITKKNLGIRKHL